MHVLLRVCMRTALDWHQLEAIADRRRCLLKVILVVFNYGRKMIIRVNIATKTYTWDTRETRQIP